MKYSKEYYEKNKAQILKRNMEYRKKNKDKVKQTEKTWREKNKEKRKEQKKIYNEKNKDKISVTTKKYYGKNKETIKAKIKLYTKSEQGKKTRKIQDKKNKENGNIKKWRTTTYKRHGEKIQENNKKWREKNKEKYLKAGREYHKKFGKVKRQIKREKRLNLIAQAWKRDVKCFCCGIQDFGLTQLLEIEHRLPRSCLRNKYPYFKVAMRTFTHDEWLLFSTCVESYVRLSSLTKLQIKRHFAILCLNCNKQVWLYGKCNIQGHKHWKKSSKWLDKEYNVVQYKQPVVIINQYSHKKKKRIII